MLLAVRVKGLNAAIVGYCPGEVNSPGVKAICVLEGTLVAVPLEQIELRRLPKRLRKASQTVEKGEVA